MDHKATLLLVLAAVLGYACGFESLIPENKELIYHYHGVMKAGTHVPVAYSSAFVLDGKLHVQNDRNSTFLKFSDLKYKMHNGRYNEWREFEGTELPLPEELGEFYKTFQVVHDASGIAVGLATECEQEFVINFQKALGSMMQLDMQQLKLDTKHPYAFHTEEYGIYGKTKQFYTVLPQNDILKVEKMMETPDTRYLYEAMATNLIPQICDDSYDQPIDSESQRMYEIVKKDDAHIIEKIESSSGVYYHPLEGRSEGFHIYSNVTLSLLTVEPIKTKIDCGFKNFQHGFDYKTAEIQDVIGAPLPDITNGRRTWKQDVLLEKIFNMLTETLQYLRQHHINDKPADHENGQLINRVVRLMMQIDSITFKKLHEKLLTSIPEEDKFKEILDIYYNIIPLVGTGASMHHIKELVKARQVKEPVALDMLETMGLHVKVPNKKLVEDMQDLMNLGDECTLDVRKAALYCFSNIIQKATYKEIRSSDNYKVHFAEQRCGEKYLPPQKWNMAQFPSAKYYEKYVTEILKKLKATEDYNMRILYMQVLGNMGMDSVVEHLLPAVKGEWFEDEYLRLVAINAIMPMINRNPDLLFEVFWPIMSDINLHMPLRIFAYYAIMESRPVVSRLVNMYWQLQNDPENELYQFHYSYMEKMSKTTDPCSQHFATRLRQLLRYSYKPQYYGLTGYYLMDYNIKDYNVGYRMDVISIMTDKTVIQKLSGTYVYDKVSIGESDMMIRVTGIDKTLLDSLKIQIHSPTGSLIQIDEFMKALKEIKNNKEFRLNLIISKNSQIIMDHNYNCDDIGNISKLFAFLAEQQTSLVKRIIDIDYTVSTTLFLPSEMGFPIVFQKYIPMVHYFDVELSRENANKLIAYHVDSTWKLWSYARHGLSFYNPVADVWQGINKYHAMDVAIPTLFDLVINPQQQSIKLSWKRFEKEEDNVMGIKSHVQTIVFVKDDFENKLLQKCSPDQHNFAVVTKHNDATQMLKQVDDANTGYHMTVKSFDSDRYHQRLSFSYEILYKKFLEANFETIWGDIISTYSHWFDVVYMQPRPVKSGILYRIEPSSEFPCTQNDLTIRLNTEFKQCDNVMRPGAKYNLRATYVVKNKEKALRTWDVTMVSEANVGQTWRGLKMQISRIIPGQNNFKICLDGNKKWKSDKVELSLDVATSHSDESKCDDGDVILKITGVGEKSEGQKSGKYQYKACEERLWSDVEELQSLECYEAYTSLRRYTFNVKTNKMPSEFVYGFMSKLHNHRSKPLIEFTRGTKTVDNESAEVIIDYPMDNADTFMTVHTSKYDIHALIPKNWYLWNSIMMPDHTEGSRLLKRLQRLGMTNMCFIDEAYLYTDEQDRIEYDMPKDWTMYLGDEETSCHHGVFTKRMEGTDEIAVRVLHNSHVFEVHPKDGHYVFTVDGKEVTDTQYSCEWVYYMWVKESNVVNIMTSHYEINMFYDGRHLELIMPNYATKFYGKCFSKAH